MNERAPNRFDLADLDSAYQTAEEPEGGDFEKLPDGTYDVIVERAEMKFTKDSGKPMLSLALIVSDGPHKDRWIWKNIVFVADPQRMGFVKRDLKFLVPNLAKLSDLSDHLPKLKGNEYVVKLSTRETDRGTFQNIYFQHGSLPLAKPADPLDDELDDLGF